MAMEPTEGAAPAAHPLDLQVRRLLQAAMVIFVWTIGIGILNGLDLVEFSRPQLLSHLHGGTLGWMTLAILAASLWLFGVGDRPLSDRAVMTMRGFSYLAVLAIIAYVAAFATTIGAFRPSAGSATLLALIGFAAFAYTRVRSVTLTVPHLLVLLGLTSSVLGGMFGVVNGMALAFGWEWVPSTFFEAHPGTMEIGFVMPAAMGLAEWALRRGVPAPISKAGWAQSGLMFAAFAWVLGFILAGLEELVGMGMVFAIAAIIIFYVRLRSDIRQTSLTSREPWRHGVAGGVFLGITIVYIFLMLLMAQGDFMAIPPGRVTSFIHLLAVGATTNALLAFVISMSRRVSGARVVDDIVFWGVNVGLLGFVVALTFDLRGLIPVFVPIMGLSLLVAIAAHIGPLNRSAPAPVP